MPREVTSYPTAHLVGNQWQVVHQVDSDVFTHVFPAAVSADPPVRLLKLGIEMIVGDLDTNQDIDDALFVDDIQPGPQTATVWSNWQALAESIYSGLTQPVTQADFYEAWRPQDTNAVRQDGNRALVQQRGWTVTHIHQHEGDGSIIDQDF